MFIIRCACHKKLNIPENLFNRRARCPACGIIHIVHVIEKPANGAAASAAPSDVARPLAQPVAAPMVAAPAWPAVPVLVPNLSLDDDAPRSLEVDLLEEDSFARAVPPPLYEAPEEVAALLPPPLYEAPEEAAALLPPPMHVGDEIDLFVEEEKAPDAPADEAGLAEDSREAEVAEVEHMPRVTVEETKRRSGKDQDEDDAVAAVREEEAERDREVHTGVVLDAEIEALFQEDDEPEPAVVAGPTHEDDVIAGLLDDDEAAAILDEEDGATAVIEDEAIEANVFEEDDDEPAPKKKPRRTSRRQDDQEEATELFASSAAAEEELRIWSNAKTGAFAVLTASEVMLTVVKKGKAREAEDALLEGTEIEEVVDGFVTAAQKKAGPPLFPLSAIKAVRLDKKKSGLEVDVDVGKKRQSASVDIGDAKKRNEIYAALRSRLGVDWEETTEKQGKLFNRTEITTLQPRTDDED